MKSRDVHELTKRIQYVIGQLAGIQSMIHDGRDPESIYVQLRAIDAAFRKSVLSTFERHYRQKLANVLLDELEKCPGPCQHCSELETAKRLFPQAPMKEVLRVLRNLKRKEMMPRA